PCPDPDAICAGRLARSSFQHELAGCGVVTRLGTSESAHLQVLSATGVRFAEGHSVGQRFEIGSVEVHLELIACLRVEAWLNMNSGDVRVDVHDEHSTGVALKDVQVVEIKLAVLTCERSIEVMRHSNT